MELLKGQALVLVVAGLAVSAALMETAAAAETVADAETVAAAEIAAAAETAAAAENAADADTADTSEGAAPTGLAKSSSERGDDAANGTAVANQAPSSEMDAEELRYRLFLSEQVLDEAKQSLAKAVRDLNAEIENSKKKQIGLITASVIAGVLAVGGIGLKLWRRWKDRSYASV